MRRFALDGGVRHVGVNEWQVWCAFTKLPSEQEALVISHWLHDLVHAAITGMEMGENVADTLRDHVADVHARDCPARAADRACSCGYDLRSSEMLREAAARIEVAVDALRPLAESEKDSDELRGARAAYYALTRERRE